ncbi:hypothetical protein GLYMA_15G057650v4 [Glycine max]|nr:hypothetical protein GLYMA_15G057650v4 [Glycine max]KAH1145754.1 hypothetical protein GYH30_041461 [Glycine max]
MDHRLGVILFCMAEKRCYMQCHYEMKLCYFIGMKEDRVKGRNFVSRCFHILRFLMTMHCKHNCRYMTILWLLC